MRLEVKQAPTNVHTDLCAAVGWTPTNELFSCSDDKTVYKWSMTGEALGKVCDIDAFCTGLHWYTAATRKQQAASDVRTHATLA